MSSGKLNGLVVTLARRSPLAAEPWTTGETGIAGFVASFGLALLAPKDTPSAVVPALNEAFAAAPSQGNVCVRTRAMNLEFVPNAPEQAADRMRRKPSGRWKWNAWACRPSDSLDRPKDR